MAEAGYIAIAPDLLSNAGADYPRTSDYPGSDAARDAFYELDPGQVTADLKLAADYAKGIDAANGQRVTAGFCWGGSQSFRFATNYDGPAAAMVFYGIAPEEAEAFNAAIEQTETCMQQAGKSYEYEIYEGAGHAFMRIMSGI